MLNFLCKIERQCPWLVPSVIIFACVLVSGIALISQYVGGHHPCILCIAQRTSYVVAAIVAAAALYLGRFEKMELERTMLLGVCALTFVYGAATAFEHVGVQSGWWSGDPLCNGSMEGFGLDSDASARLAVNPIFDVPDVTCSQGTWTLFGFSMAFYNLLANVGLMALATAGALLGLSRMSAAQSRSKTESQ